MEFTAGVSGRVSSNGKQFNFLLHEFEITHDLLDEDEVDNEVEAEEPPKKRMRFSRAHPVHRGVRIYLQQRDSETPTEQVLQFMKHVDMFFSKDLTDVDRRLICPTCLSDGNQSTSEEGFYNMDQQLVPEDDLNAALCSTMGHILPQSFTTICIPENNMGLGTSHGKEIFI